MASFLIFISFKWPPLNMRIHKISSTLVRQDREPFRIVRFDETRDRRNSQLVCNVRRINYHLII